MTTAKAVDICKGKNAFNLRKIEVYKIVSVITVTQGAYSATKEVNGFVNLLTQHIGLSILEARCIIDQQDLCAKIRFNSYRHRKFSVFLIQASRKIKVLTK